MIKFGLDQMIKFGLDKKLNSSKSPSQSRRAGEGSISKISKFIMSKKHKLTSESKPCIQEAGGGIPLVSAAINLLAFQNSCFST